ncbi:phage tail tape measure protein [Nitratidesulfovibrio sp.]|uniref:phage tail tape measure protein n=1 Tax=Nitratidesulfovibrio sp. TaxID=2802297 RepID=UPI00333FD025
MNDMSVQVTLRLRDQMGRYTKRALDDVTRATGDATTAARGLARAGADTDRMRFGGLLNGLRQVDRLSRAAMQSLRGVASAASNAAKAAGQVGSGLTAGGYVAGRALAKPMDYEHRVAQMANTAYAERDVAGRRAGMTQLDASITGAVRTGGGTRDEAAEALDKMLASGAIKADAATSLLPVLQKYSTASGAASGDLADIVIRGVQQGFFKPEEAQAALDRAMVAGQMGGFELKDMARWLPQMMANAQGMKGMAGFERILASAQASAVTAGNKDQAGNNLVNLLAKMNSSDAALDFKKLGIDLSGSLAKARENGELPLDAFVRLVETRVVGKDKRFQAARAKAAGATGGDRASALNDMADILQASAVGRVMQDRQALLALVAEMTQKGYVADVLGGMRSATGAGETAFGVVASTSAFKAQQASNEKDIAASGMLAHVKPYLDPAMERLAAFGAEFPALTTAAMEATTAIGAMTAAAAAFGGLRMLTGGAGAAGAGGAAGMAGRGARFGKLAGRLAGRAGGLLAVAGAAYDVYATEQSAMNRNDKNAAHVATAGGLGGTLAGASLGAKAGAALGTLVAPGIGTAVGAGVGGIGGGLLGWLGGTGLGQKLGDMIFKDERVVRVESVLQLDGREVARAVNEVNGRDATRH